MIVEGVLTGSVGNVKLTDASGKVYSLSLTEHQSNIFKDILNTGDRVRAEGGGDPFQVDRLTLLGSP